MKKLDKYHRELKKRVESCYEKIRSSEKELEQIREKECKHPQSEKVNYMWAPGHIMPDTTVCSICGKVLKTYMSDFMWSCREIETLPNET